MRILLVEDTDDVAQAIVSRLSGMGHAVDRIADGAVAAGMVTAEYDLVILDVMLPGMDGFALLTRLREAGKDTKVLMLTACGEIDERVRALDLGADDYLMKPFDYRELEARVRVLLRRTGGDSTNLLHCANVTIDRGSTRDTTIGEGTKIDNLVQIAHNVSIGRHCLIAGQVGISGSARLGDFVMLGGKVGIADHVSIGTGASLGAQSGVMSDVPAGARWIGSPAQPVRDFMKGVAVLRRLARGKREGGTG